MAGLVTKKVLVAEAVALTGAELELETETSAVDDDSRLMFLSSCDGAANSAGGGGGGGGDDSVVAVDTNGFVLLDPPEETGALLEAATTEAAAVVLSSSLNTLSPCPFPLSCCRCCSWGLGAFISTRRGLSVLLCALLCVFPLLLLFFWGACTRKTV